MLKLDELKVFITTAEAGSFVGAADLLGVAPSVVSKTIKSLETKLNTTLFNRTTRSMAITSEGEWLLAQASKTMETLDAVTARFIDKRGEPQGRLTIDAASPIATHALAPVISRFAERYPKVEIAIESNETIADLIAGRVDIAIRIGALTDSSLKAIRIGHTERALYASPDYLRRFGEPYTTADLKRHRCLGFTRPRSLNTWPLQSDTGSPVTIEPHMTANSGEILKQLALYGNGIACISRFTVRRELQQTALIPLLIDQILPHAIPIHAVFYSERSLGRHVRLFLDFLAETLEFTV